MEKISIKKRMLSLIITLLMFMALGITAYAEDAKVTGSGSVGFTNLYIFRGYEIGKSGLLIQPSLSASYNGFSAAFWGNIDTDQRTSTSAVFPEEGKKGWNETDFTLSYTFPVDKLSITAGGTYYAVKYATETQELWLTMALDAPAKPTFSIYQDIEAYKGTYLNLAFAHSIPLPKDISLDLGASFGYEMGQADYWKTYEPSTGTFTGNKYKTLHDGMMKAGLTIPIAKSLSMQPVVQYWFPLSSDAKNTFGINPETGLKVPFNPNGYVTNNLIFTVGFSYSF